VRDAELIIHNAPFDVAFLNAELRRLPDRGRRSTSCAGARYLELARQMHPGQRNNLDALCKRYSVDNTHRESRRAARRAHPRRSLSGDDRRPGGAHARRPVRRRPRAADRSLPTPRSERRRIAVVKANEAELAAHAHSLALLDKASGGKTVWRKI
jgi:DNA polymerase III subunit epsilon